MTSDGTKCYEYNEANQMKKAKTCSGNVTIAEYIYDYNGNRMVKKNYTSGTLVNTVYSWSDSYETKVIVGGATESIVYYFANDQLIAKKDNSGTKTYFHNDHLGSTSVITNSGGTLVEQTKYDPWGEVISGGSGSKFLYTGQEKDSETGLHYYNARYYSSTIRRFVQPDVVIQNVFNPQMLNRYSYAQNNPLRYIDPTGHAVSIPGLYITNITNPQIKFNSGAINVGGFTSVLSSTTNKQNTIPSFSHGSEDSFSKNSFSNASDSAPSNQSFANASNSVLDKVIFSNKNYPTYAPTSASITNNIAEASQHKYDPIWFTSKVMEGGDWDYKKYNPDYADFGNYNYGATGRAAGFPGWVLLGMGGAVQQSTNIKAFFKGYQPVDTKGVPFLGYPNGDAYENGWSADQYWINKGTILYDENY